MSPSNIVLVGFMGTGKSVVGRALALRLGWELVDTDEVVEQNAGRSIAALFAEEGEAGFRARETAALRSLTNTTGRVIATGGGILGCDENLALLRAIGPIVCLTAQPEVILARTRPWQDRPLLARADDPRAEVERLLKKREPRYRLADFTLDTSDWSVDEVVERIWRALT